MVRLTQSHWPEKGYYANKPTLGSAHDVAVTAYAIHGGANATPAREVSLMAQPHAAAKTKWRTFKVK